MRAERLDRDLENELKKILKEVEKREIKRGSRYAIN